VSDPTTTTDEAIATIVRSHLDCLGPTTIIELAAWLGLSERDVEAAMLALEVEGTVLRGRFRQGASELEWCHRRTLARIHQLTLQKLRKEIAPVSAADFMRFLFRWQHVAPGTQLHGTAGLLNVIEQLQGFEVAAAAWEGDVLAARIEQYRPALLDELCFSGEIAWGRLAMRVAAADEDGAPSRSRATPTRAAPLALVLREDLPWLLQPGAEPAKREARPFSGTFSPPANACRLRSKTACSSSSRPAWSRPTVSLAFVSWSTAISVGLSLASASAY
jgi:ATP-dependent Lhr-like helicase